MICPGVQRSYFSEPRMDLIPPVLNVSHIDRQAHLVISSISSYGIDAFLGMLVLQFPAEPFQALNVLQVSPKKFYFKM